MDGAILIEKCLLRSLLLILMIVAAVACEWRDCHTVVLALDETGMLLEGESLNYRLFVVRGAVLNGAH